MQSVKSVCCSVLISHTQFSTSVLHFNGCDLNRRDSKRRLSVLNTRRSQFLGASIQTPLRRSQIVDLSSGLCTTIPTMPSFVAHPGSRRFPVAVTPENRFTAEPVAPCLWKQGSLSACARTSGFHLVYLKRLTFKKSYFPLKIVLS